MSCQNEPALTQLTSHSQPSLSSPRGLEIKTRGHLMTFIVETPLGMTFLERKFSVLSAVIGCVSGDYCPIIALLSYGIAIASHHSFDGTLLAQGLPAGCDL